MAKTFPVFMELAGYFLYSQEPSTDSFPELIKFDRHQLV